MWNFSQFGHTPAIIDDKGHMITYQQLQDAGESLCAVIGHRCLVFNMCDNVLGSLVGYVSFINGAIVPAMIKSDLDDDMLEKLYLDYQPDYIWVGEENTSRQIFTNCHRVYEDMGFVLLQTEFVQNSVMNPDLALLLTTSGSTGSPKFVRQSYGNIQANTESIVEYLHLDHNERPITTLPLNYTYGLSIVNTHFYVGATVLLTNATLMQREFWQFFREEQATSFGGVPYTYEMLKRLRMNRMDLPSLKTMTQAGGKLLPELHKEFAQFARDTGREFVVMYGQCEATARMAYLPPERNLDKVGSMGIAIPGGRFTLIDTKEQPITEPGTVGELVYYGDNVTLGYAENREDLSRPNDFGGCLHTGDMARFDEDGYFYVVGRKKRFLKIYGNRVNLDEAERMLKQEFEESEIACGGVDDHLFIFATQEKLLPEMKHFLSEKTGLNPAAFTTRKITGIPHNEAGKTLYRELEQYYE